jgi:hypothetical protein
LAEAILADIDRNRDEVVSAGERRAYASLVMSALTLDVDGTRLPMRLDASDFPEAEAVRRGEGTIRLHAVAVLPRMSAGSHQLLFRNRHHRDRSVYLANALVPGSADVAITAQRRDANQSELIIDYVVRGLPATSTARLLFGGLAAATVLSLLVRSVRL